MDKRSSFQNGLINSRDKALKSIKLFFQDKAVEAHVFGSMARGNTDALSDIDIWFTFKDANIGKALEQRLEYYAQIGEIVHVCEPPQNSPTNGVHSCVLYKTEGGLLQVDFYICPLSTSFRTEESKQIFGDIKLPLGELGFNSQKISVSDFYRIDFFVLFVFIAIKRLARKKQGALDLLFAEYDNLKNRYDIDVRPLENRENTFMCMRQVIAKISNFSSEKQKSVLKEISAFAGQVEKNIPLK
ncbi:MAG: nucleotidyltransferase domain-containing protein [bacterium]|nr:nucleotidyltransferase domain-containing protein [bacterium]